jgi:multiple antibiotic resistance protein
MVAATRRACVHWRMSDLIAAFLLSFPAMLSIANPIGGAFVFAALTGAYSITRREHVARLVGIYTLLITVVAAGAGSFVLGFFGITLPAVRVGGGLLIVISALDMLRAEDPPGGEDLAQVSTATNATDIAFVPLTMPLTAGPGMISVAIALGAEHPAATDSGHNELHFFLGLALATLAMAVAVWLIFRSASKVVRLLSPSGFRTLGRLIGFLVLCIGVQMIMIGMGGLMGGMPSQH